MAVNDVKCEIDQLGEALSTILNEWYNNEVLSAVGDAVDETTKETRDIIKENANVEKLDPITKRYRFPRRKGKYKKNIGKKTKRNRYTGAEGIVYGKNREYALTHLLENGHRLWQSPGRSTGKFVHWKTGEEHAIEELPKKIIKNLKG